MLRALRNHTVAVVGARAAHRLVEARTVLEADLVARVAVAVERDMAADRAADRHWATERVVGLEVERVDTVVDTVGLE